MIQKLAPKLQTINDQVHEANKIAIAILYAKKSQNETEVAQLRKTLTGQKSALLASLQSISQFSNSRYEEAVIPDNDTLYLVESSKNLLQGVSYLPAIVRMDQSVAVRVAVSIGRLSGELEKAKDEAIKTIYKGLLNKNVQLLHEITERLEARMKHSEQSTMSTTPHSWWQMIGKYC